MIERRRGAMMYRIRAIRNGGFLGYAEAWLKRDDEIYETENKEEAEREAARLTEAMNNSFNPACFIINLC